MQSVFKSRTTNSRDRYQKPLQNKLKAMFER
jgi:hypothetical protein